jgi:phosphoglycolate phosphatase
MHRVSAVVFDLDGTLIDSRRDIAASANFTLEAHGRPRLDEATIVSFVGDGARELVLRCFAQPRDRTELDAAEYDAALVDTAEVDGAEIDAALVTFMDYYTAHPAVHTELLPGVEQMLNALSELPLALCTNKPRRVTDPVLEALGLTHRFRASWAGGDSDLKKPDPDPLLRLCAALGFPPEQMVLVGDGPQDVECGKRAGARTIGVEGMGSVAALKASAPDALVTIPEVAPLIQSWRA